MMKFLINFWGISFLLLFTFYFLFAEPMFCK